MTAIPLSVFGQSPTPTRLREAATALINGDIVLAESDLQEILKVTPGDTRALNLLGMVRAEQHRNDEAERLFLRVIEHDPKMAGAHVNLGLLYAQTSRTAEAVTQLENALRIEPNRRDAVTALAGLLRTEARTVAATNPEEALSYLVKARKVAPEDPDVLCDFGMVALRVNLNNDAAEAFRSALANRQDDPAALYGLGRAQIGLAKYQDARATFEHYLKLKPSDPSARYAMGLALAALQQPEDAKREFESSIQLQPAQTESYFQLGLLMLEQRQLDSAAEDFHHVLERDARHEGALTGIGRVEFERKNYSSAEMYFRQAIVADSEQRQAHYYLGLTLARLGQKEESAKELETASRIEHAELEKQQAATRIENPR